MIRRLLQLLLRLCPADFRDRCGEELIELYVWRAASRRGPLERTVLALQEVLGLSLVLVQLRAASLRSGARTRLPTAWELLQPDPVRWSGPALAGGAVMFVVGTGIGFGAGVDAGFTLVPVTLMALAWGLAGRARSASELSPWTRQVARASASCAASLAILLALKEFAPGPFDMWAAVLCYPAVVGFELGVIAVGVRGILFRELPLVPAVAVTAGMLMILTGLTPVERVAELGVWVSLVGWVAFAVAPWGRPDQPLPEAIER